MVQGYQTLQEAAQFLGMSADELKLMAQRNQIRSFQDRGTLRFRIQDIQEMARQRGASSDPDLVLGEAPPPSGSAPRTPPGPKTPRQVPPASAQDVFEFDFDGGEDVDIGHELFANMGPQSGSKSKSPRPASPRPQAGSDSDVRLVSDMAVGGEDFSLPVGSDSDVKLVGEGAPRAEGDSNVRLAPATPPTGSAGRSSKLGPQSPQPKRPSRLGNSPSPQPRDSGVRLVPMDSDSDVKIVGAGSDEVQLGAQGAPSSSDSDVRLEKVLPPHPDAGEMGMLTEEINLDEEIRRQEAAQAQQGGPGRVKPRSQVKFASESPFELSDSDLNAPSSASGQGLKPDSSDFDLSPQGAPEDSSDFDLSPLQGSAVGGSDDFSLELPPDDSVLGGSGEGELSGPSSGISLNNPVDAGISLEEPGTDDSIDFDLSLEAEPTPRPTQAPSMADSDSEFELSLDIDDSAVQKGLADSDSEFELTLDDSGNLAPLEEEAPQLADSGEKDIFETDFEVPGLDDSGTVDSEIESSDFDIRLDDSDLADEESGSQVVALDEEADEAAETVTGDDEDLAEISVEEDFGGLEGLEGEEVEAEVEEEGEVEVREKVVEKMLEPAPWGAMPVALMLPCVIVMLLVGIMGFELVQSATGYKQPGFLTRTFSKMIGKEIK